LLVAAIAYAFGPVVSRNAEFILYDDNRYVTENGFVQQGLTLQTVRWAFTAVILDNWHPLTWLSHMLDCEMYGLQPGAARWHHLTSIVIHALTSIGLFLVLSRLTRSSWPSALAAVIFAVHPLRAESVAWIAERKDTLSGLFLVLTLAAYGEYARGLSLSGHAIANVTYRLCFYTLTLFFYACGLMSKPMLVSLPLLLLLLDYWPLGRFKVAATASPALNALFLIIEKIPLAIMAIASGIVTMHAQQGAMLVIENITPSLRIQNAIVSYAAYVVQLFAPIGLTPLYPYPEHGIPAWKVALAGCFLIAISAAVVVFRSRRYLVVGWLWFVVSLVPVIGLVQVGVQGMADRYTYIPHIGLCIMLAWLLRDLTLGLPFRDLAWTIATAAIAVILTALTNPQSATWTTNEVFFTHALDVNPQIALAHNNLGWIRERQEQQDNALWHYREALKIRPRYVEAHINLGNVLMKKGDTKAGIEEFRQATIIRPDYSQGYVNLGVGLLIDGQKGAAVESFREAVKLEPDYTDARVKLAMALLETGKVDNSVKELQEVLKRDANNVAALEMLGNIDLQTQKIADAAACFNKCIQLGGETPPLTALAGIGYLAYTTHKPSVAVADWRKILEQKPKSLTALTMLAWTLSTCDDNAIRNGAEAQQFARAASEVSGGKNPLALMTFAAALAECGQFDNALQVANRATEMAQAQNEAKLVEFLGRQSTSYNAHLPFRDPVGMVFFSIGDIMAVK
jgi:tetratricopeptide (TPR) repeat protein